MNAFFYDDGTLFFLFGYLLVLKHVSTCRHILLQKDSAFEMRSAKEQDIISNSKHCINAMTSYQFRVIVGLSISSHCINFKSLYQFRVIESYYHIKFKLYQCHDMACFWVIVSISSHCRPINFESFY